LKTAKIINGNITLAAPHQCF